MEVGMEDSVAAQPARVDGVEVRDAMSWFGVSN